MTNIGLWPAFWLYHGEIPNNLDDNCNNTNLYWSEEVDIFEPGACQVSEGINQVHYWTLVNNYLPDIPSNNWTGPGYTAKINVDMWNWHTYSVDWEPNGLTFYYDRVAFLTCTAKVPAHPQPALLIDLQTDNSSCKNPVTTGGTFVGSFDVDYFHYYATQLISGPQPFVDQAVRFP